MIVYQDYCYKICGGHSSEFNRELDVYHNYSTGEVRGLLYKYYNSFLGEVPENTDFLQKNTRLSKMLKFSPGAYYYDSNNNYIYCP